MKREIWENKIFKLPFDCMELRFSNILNGKRLLNFLIKWENYMSIHKRTSDTTSSRLIFPTLLTLNKKILPNHYLKQQKAENSTSHQNDKEFPST